MDANLASWTREWSPRPGPARRAAPPAEPPRSLAAVLRRVVRASLSSTWSPVAAAETLTSGDVPDVVVLRIARARLRQLDGERPTLVGARSIATLNMAIARLEPSSAGSAARG